MPFWTTWMGCVSIVRGRIEEEKKHAIRWSSLASPRFHALAGLNWTLGRIPATYALIMTFIIFGISCGDNHSLYLDKLL